MSDLHVDYPGSRGFPPLAHRVDAVVVAGDTCAGLVPALNMLRRAYPEPAVILTTGGNHEFYSKKLPYREHLAAGRETASRLGVQLMENDVVYVGPLRVLGCTLWTDYLLFGEGLRGAAMRTAAETMMDHRRIQWRREPWQRFRPEEARALHLQSRAFLERELAKQHDGPTACIFHHAAVPDAVEDRLRRSMLTAAYASDLGPLIDRYQPELVVTGHTHHSIDIRRGRSRIVSNPAGYADENEFYDFAFIVEVDNA
jgi:hypothetical protein